MTDINNSLKTNKLPITPKGLQNENWDFYSFFQPNLNFFNLDRFFAPVREILNSISRTKELFITQIYKQVEELTSCDNIVRRFIIEMVNLQNRICHSLEQLPQVQVAKGLYGDEGAFKNFVKKRWWRVRKYIRLKLELEDEDIMQIDNEFIISLIALKDECLDENEILSCNCEVCQTMKEDNLYKKMPIWVKENLPKKVYWKLVNKFLKELKEIYNNQRKVIYTNNPESIKLKKNSTGDCFSYNGEEYILIDQIGEIVSLTSQVLRNMDKKGSIRFNKLSYQPRYLKKPILLNAVLKEEVPEFINKIKECRTPKPPLNHFPTKEACKRLGKSRQTLYRGVKKGKLPPPCKIKGKCFWKLE